MRAFYIPEPGRSITGYITEHDDGNGTFVGGGLTIPVDELAMQSLRAIGQSIAPRLVALKPEQLGVTDTAAKDET